MSASLLVMGIGIGAFGNSSRWTSAVRVTFGSQHLSLQQYITLGRVDVVLSALLTCKVNRLRTSTVFSLLNPPRRLRFHQCWFVSWLAALNKSCFTNFHIIWWKGGKKWRFSVVVNTVVSTDAVAIHWARLVLGWVTAFRQVNCLTT